MAKTTKKFLQIFGTWAERQVLCAGSEPFSGLIPAPQLAQTVGTDVFALEDGNILEAVAENAGRAVFLQYDVGAVHKNLHALLLADVQRAAKLGGQDDPA